MSGENTDDKFVEIEGDKFKADPDDLEKALMGEDGQPIPFEEKETEEDKKERERLEKEEDDKDPPLRRSARTPKDHIIKRLQKKRNKSKEEEDEEDDNEFTAEGNEAINQKIKDGLKPILEQVRGDSDDQELKAVLDKYPEAEKMKAKIEKYMKAYKNTPAEFIYLGLAKQLIDKNERLNKKKDEADEEALKNTTGGTPKRPKALPKIPDVTKMSDKAVLELADKVRTGQFGK